MKTNLKNLIRLVNLTPLSIILFLSVSCSDSGKTVNKKSTASTQSQNLSSTTSTASSGQTTTSTESQTVVKLGPILINPLHNQVDVSLTQSIQVVFNQEVSQSDLENELKVINVASGQEVSGVLSTDDEIFYSFTPDQALLSNQYYLISINNDLTSFNGTSLDKTIISIFKTATSTTSSNNGGTSGGSSGNPTTNTNPIYYTPCPLITATNAEKLSYENGIYYRDIGSFSVVTEALIVGQTYQTQDSRNCYFTVQKDNLGRQIITDEFIGPMGPYVQCVHPYYKLDERYNPSGLAENRCANDCDCDGARTCSRWGWCQGVSR